MLIKAVIDRKPPACWDQSEWQSSPRQIKHCQNIQGGSEGRVSLPARPSAYGSFHSSGRPRCSVPGRAHTPSPRCQQRCGGSSEQRARVGWEAAGQKGRRASPDGNGGSEVPHPLLSCAHSPALTPQSEHQGRLRLLQELQP